jgi:hypothetical protein
MEEFNKGLDKLRVCDTKEAIASVINYYKAFKAAYQDLLSMTKAATNRLKAAAERALKDKSNANSAAARAKAAAKAKPKAAPAKVSLWEVISNIAASMPAVSDPKKPKEFDHSSPTIVRADAKAKLFDVTSEFMKSSLLFEERFDGSAEKVDPGRGQRKYVGPAVAEVGSFMMEVFGEGTFVQPDDEKMKATLVPVVFCVAKNRETCSAETGHLATVRFGLKGTRSVIAVSTLSLWEYLKIKEPTAEVQPKMLYAWLKNTTADNLKSFMESSGNPKVYFATVGPHDALYLPPAFTFFERVGNNGFLGCRYQFLAASHFEALEGLNKLVLSSMQPNATLQATVDALALKK